MEKSSAIDLTQLAKHLKLDVASLQSTVELLEEGNTVPFIARFRRDQTGGLDELQIRSIQRELSRHKQLHERKESVLKSIESRQQLSPELQKKIQAARTMRVLEDLYLPYKPKKKSLAYVARSRGLEPLAEDIFKASAGAVPLTEAAAKLVNADKELPNADAVIHGVQHLLAEYFCNDPELRSMLRRHMWQHGQLVSKKVDEPIDFDDSDVDASDESEPDSYLSLEETDDDGSEENITDRLETPVTSSSSEDAQAETEPGPGSTEETADAQVVTTEGEQNPTASDVSTDTTNDNVGGNANAPSEPSETAAAAPEAETAAAENAESVAAELASASAADAKKQAAADNREKKKAAAREQRRTTRRRRRERLVQSFKDYFDFKDPLGRLPHHRILAINRGERTKVLRVKVECGNWDKLISQLKAKAIPEDHPYASFLDTCLQDALNRLLIPSIEREVRRELNDRAEEHAVRVFAKNLRKLLLQPPLSGHRVVAIDPGFRSGCKVVALDAFGKLLGHTFINLLGKDQQREQGRMELAKFVREHSANVIAVGNGAACRETEALVGELLANELKDEDVGYLIVNEAGTSVYSTSELGREELPDVDPTVRSAVSIGRRALDPLSELVKVDPASIGVGLYQHDVKAKHLRESLDDVVESCVNYVGVDVNSASPSLLRYVSGLNKMTASQIYKHREKHGPFKSREELKSVSGVGESSYVQAAGFLKIKDGENCLDGTWIHPESYAVAERVLAAIGLDSGDLPRSPNTSANVTTPALDTNNPSADTASATDPSTTDPSTTDPSTTHEDAKPTEAVRDDASKDASAVTVAETLEATEAVESPSGEPTEATTNAEQESTAEQANAEPVATENVSGEDALPQETPASDETPVAELAPPPPNSQNERLAQLRTKLSAVDVGRLAPQLGVGKLLLQDILTALARPGRDPREDLPSPAFRKGVLKLEDLKPEMELSGTVLNVVDFGAFVDIGLVDSGLIHVSRLADKYVSDPHEVVSVGDILRVWVVEVDNSRRRVSLTAIEPGTERPKREREPRKPRESQSRPKPGPKGTGKKRREDRRGQGKRGDHKPKEFRPKAPPKPFVPITKEMEDGKEPLRTFGDLKQLFDKKKGKGQE